MPLTSDEAKALGQRMWAQIERRRNSNGSGAELHPQGIRGCLDYYRGLHNLRFASTQFSDHFKSRFGGFTDNWCAPVIDSTAERLNWLGIRLGNETREADAEFQRVMEANDVPSGMSEAFTVALAATRSFALVWGNSEDEQTPLVTFEHPEFCVLATEPGTRKTVAGAKGWLDTENGMGYLTLYMPDEVWKWEWSVADRDQSNPRKQPEWTPRQGTDDTWPIKNPMGRVPLVEFRNATLLDDMPLSDLSGVAAMQDAINLGWAYLFNSMDFASLPQRVVTGADVPRRPVLDENGQIIAGQSMPIDMKQLKDDRLLWITDENAKIESWPAADLKVFGDVIEMAVEHIASQTRTPPHYLLGKMSNVAAESLTVAETGLVAKVEQRQQYFTRPIRELHSLVALAQGGADGEARAKASRTGQIVWRDPQYRSQAQMVDGFLKLGQSGLPLRVRLEWWGRSPQEIDRIMDIAKAEPEQIIAPKPVPAPEGEVLPRGESITEAPATPPMPDAGPTAAPAA